MNKPTISIIVPYYNSQEYISKCINSILNQTFRNFELILIDDGSTDNSYNICLSYANKDDRIQLLQKENGGQGLARNIGLDIARGDFIGFVDSDDYIDKRMYEIMLNNCISENADLAVCGYNVYRSQTKQPKPLMQSPKTTFDNLSLMEAYLSTSIISGGPCNKLYSKKLFANLRFPALRMREDSYLMPHILEKVSKAIYVGHNLYNWNLRIGSTERSNFNSSHLSALKSVESLESVIKAKYPQLIKYVDTKHIQSRVDILKKIIISNCYFKYQEPYKKLLNEICNKLENLKSDKRYFSEKYKEARCACRFNLFFMFKVYLIGHLKLFVKMIISRYES